MLPIQSVFANTAESDICEGLEKERKIKKIKFKREKVSIESDVTGRPRR